MVFLLSLPIQFERLYFLKKGGDTLQSVWHFKGQQFISVHANHRPSIDPLSVLTFCSCSGRTMFPLPSVQCRVLRMINKVCRAMTVLQGPVWEKREIFENQFLKCKLISAGFYKGLKWLSQHFSSSSLSFSTGERVENHNLKKSRKNKLKYFIFLSSSFIKNERHWGKRRDNFLAQSKSHFGITKYLIWEVMTSSEFITCSPAPGNVSAPFIDSRCPLLNPVTGDFAEAAGTRFLSGSNPSPPSTASQPRLSSGSGLLKCKWV